MSKYTALWEYVQKSGEDSLQLRFDEISNMIGFELNHAFLKYKKELLAYGYEVGKISMKEKTVMFHRLTN